MSYIHREGNKTIIVTITSLAAINFGLHQAFHLGSLFSISIASLSVLFLAFILAFFRNPRRLFPLNENHVLSPADGKVVVIEEVYEPEYFKDNRIQVSIFMSPANVHINRYPINGKATYVKYHPGKYLVAWHPKSSTENERSTIVIENKSITLLLRQIAGAVARRIVFYSKEGGEVRQADELGFIKFGSRVDVFLPIHTTIKIKLGEKVLGGITKIAEY